MVDDIVKKLQEEKRYKKTIGNKTILVTQNEYGYLLSTTQYNGMGVPSYTYNNMTLTEVLRYFKELEGVSAK